MIFDNFEGFSASGFKPKVILIGSGPSGITIARKLAAAGIPVAIFEAGQSDVTEESQDVYKGKTVGDYYFDLDVTRLRYFGGCSNHWAGWCRVMDAVDFEPKPWVPDTGWPIRRTDIEPYLDEVHDILDLVPFRDDVAISDDIRWVQLIKSPAVRFAEKYRTEIEESKTIALVLDTYVTKLQGDGTKVTGAHVWSAGKDQGVATADYYIPCTGGLENSRLLLWSNEQSNGAVVPHAEALGKYWMEHPQFEGGNAIMNNPDQFEMDDVSEAFFSPSFEAMQREQIMNFGIRFIKMPYHGAKWLVAELACVAPETAEWVSNGVGGNLRCAAQLVMGWEQAPRADNFIALSATDKDTLGIPRIELHWKKSELEHRTLLQGLRLFGKTLAEKDYGRVRIDEWVLNDDPYPTDQELAGHHHMGGTRMGDDLAKSVVDRDQKVHGMSNLYVGGSSVFATSGQCNPTTTIVALSCRLGDHLAKRIGQSAMAQ
ncbi:GMC oxidoreductase [Mesorhizobium sp. IMUNJ 23232]|uniref:GMC oxidoreductase n=1 Tax=Mesorhizobium sp. IMUNJ 23232 TaxID=3376064 RepID=UPI00379F9FB1